MSNPEMSKLDITIETLKVSVLVVFLLVAFKHSQFPDSLWEPLKLLLKWALLGFSYMVGTYFSDLNEEKWKTCITIFYGISILTIASWAGLGTHLENSDPLFGGGDTVVDFIPTAVERSNHAINIFFSLLIPAVIGVYRGRNPS